MLLGESETGKELLARKVHDMGQRRAEAFLAVTCAAIPGEPFESELFGHAAGAFSGASREKRGLLETADRGTIFLDEVGEIPPPFQAKLLRVLDDREVRRLGETGARRIDFRLICATNRDIKKEVDGGRFRFDLYYRINVFSLTLPPLRERTSRHPGSGDALHPARRRPHRPPPPGHLRGCDGEPSRRGARPRRRRTLGSATAT